VRERAVYGAAIVAVVGTMIVGGCLAVRSGSDGSHVERRDTVAAGRADGGPSTVPTTTATTPSTVPPTTTRPMPPAHAVPPATPGDRPVSLAATYAYGSRTDQLLDVFVPAHADGPAPVLVYLHSGGWIAGERHNIPELVARELDRGWAIVSVDYALAPDHRFPVPVADADLAVRWVRAHAAPLGLRDDAVVVAGSSAGGHLAAWLAANPGRHRADEPALDDIASGVDGAVLLVAPVVMADLRAHEDTFAPAILAAYLGCRDGLARNCSDDALVAADPTRHLTGPPAPLYALHGGLDTMFPPAVHGVALATAWDRAGGRAVVDVAPSGGHDLDPTNSDPAALDRFLDELAAGGAATGPGPGRDGA
jgi:acetyl esterase/lipase